MTDRKPMPPIGRRWKKGQSGNPAGRPPDLLREATLKRIGVDRIAELAAERMEAGDARVIGAVLDRLWPKPPSEHRVEATGADGSPLIPAEIANARERLLDRLRPAKAATQPH